MSAVLLARVDAFGGDQAVGRLLELAGSKRSREYLLDITNWISYGEATALWQAGTRVTHHPEYAHAVGQDAAERLNASPVAALLRSLGSPENVYRQIATSASKFSVAAQLEATDAGPGFAEIVATAAPHSSAAHISAPGRAACSAPPQSCSGSPERMSSTCSARRTALRGAATASLGTQSRQRPRRTHPGRSRRFASSSTLCASACTACSPPPLT
jgi:hypothetical protein